MGCVHSRAVAYETADDPCVIKGAAYGDCGRPNNVPVKEDGTLSPRNLTTESQLQQQRELKPKRNVFCSESGTAPETDLLGTAPVTTPQQRVFAYSESGTRRLLASRESSFARILSGLDDADLSGSLGQLVDKSGSLRPTVRRTLSSMSNASVRTSSSGVAAKPQQQVVLLDDETGEGIAITKMIGEGGKWGAG